MFIGKYTLPKCLIFGALIAVFIIVFSGCTSTAAPGGDSANPIGPGLTSGDPPTGGSFTGLQGGSGTGSGGTGGSGTGSGGGTGAGGSGNMSPVVTIKAASSMVGVSEELSLTAESIDPDGDLVSLSWNASAGVFVRQNTTSAVWKAPTSPGEYEISCLAEDRKGGRSNAAVKIGVIGGRTYVLEVKLSRYSLLSKDIFGTSDSEWISVPSARVSFNTLGEVLTSDDRGKIELDLDTIDKTASGSEVVVSYGEMEIKYRANFMSSGISQVDELQFYPNYDGITVAVGRGDSFATKRGGLEIKTVQDINGQVRPLDDVTVEMGTTQQLAIEGVAFLNLPSSNEDMFVNLSKAGYRALEGLRIPVSMDGLTLVNARLVPTGSISRAEAGISYTRPYNGQTGVSVMGPFEIGFSQAMEKGTVFDDFEMTVQDSSGKSAEVIKGYDVRNKFSIQWISPNSLKLIPNAPFSGLKRYSLHVTRWNARTIDGRVLKNYSNMFGTFSTNSDEDPHIVSTSPRNGDAGVARSGPFEVTFDQSIDPSSLTKDVLIEITNVKTGSLVSVDSLSFANHFSVNWTENDKKLAMVPKKILRANNPYRVRLVRNGLKSKTGKTLSDVGSVWGQFTTGEL